jgi:pyrroloquinoline quinone (PQQ) biosynthesis protein C
MRFYEQLCRDSARERESLLAVPLIRNALQGRIAREEYVGFLTQAYHHVRHTVPLLMACGSRLPQRLGWLRKAIAHYIEEEVGHEEWILDDIAACGEDAELVHRTGISFETRVLVAYAYDVVDRGNPVGFLGMVHVLEGTSVAVASAAADAIQTSLGLPDAGFTYLRSHGSLDLEHVHFFETLLDRLHDARDRTAITDVARDIYRLYADMFRGIARDARVVAAA